MSENALTYAGLGELLNTAGIVTDAAEFHGGLCGCLCAAGRAGAQLWLQASLRDGLDRGSVAALQVLAEDAWQLLCDAELGLQPLLPSDDDDLQMRVDALAGWCRGFLSGLGVAGWQRGAQTTDDDEIVGDFAEIGRAQFDAESAADEPSADFDYAELVEYARVGMQILFENLQIRHNDGPRITH